MSPQEKIIAIAELDGWTEIDISEMGIKPNYPKYPNPAKYRLPNYLISRDAIVSALRNQYKSWTREQEEKFILHLSELVNPNNEIETILATPSQLSDALLIATGKMKQ